MRKLNLCRFAAFLSPDQLPRSPRGKYNDTDDDDHDDNTDN